MHLEVFKGESDLWHVRLVGGNGETMMHSEAYADKDNAVHAADTIAGVTGLDITILDEDD